MAIWFRQGYGNRIEKEPMNKLTLRWREVGELMLTLL